MEGSWDIPNTDSEPGKSKCVAKGNQKKCPIKVIQTNTRVRLSLSPPVCLPTHTILFFLLTNTCLLTLHLCGTSLQSWRVWALSLATGLVVRVQCSHWHNPDSISGQEPKKPCFKPLQAGPPKITSRISPTQKTNLNTKIQETKKTVAEEGGHIVFGDPIPYPSLPHIVFGDPNIHRILRVS